MFHKKLSTKNYPQKNKENSYLFWLQIKSPWLPENERSHAHKFLENKIKEKKG